MDKKSIGTALLVANPGRVWWGELRRGKQFSGSGFSTLRVEFRSKFSHDFFSFVQCCIERKRGFMSLFQDPVIAKWKLNTGVRFKDKDWRTNS
jgi:hypothetical protein